MPTPSWLRKEDLPVDASGRYYIDPPSLDQILDQHKNWRGDVTATGYRLIGVTLQPGNVDLGQGQVGNRQAYIDFIGDDTYTDYGLRIIRNDTGPNTSSQLKHRGTGGLEILTQEAAPVILMTGGAEHFRVAANGNVGINNA